MHYNITARVTVPDEYVESFSAASDEKLEEGFRFSVLINPIPAEDIEILTVEVVR